MGFVAHDLGVDLGTSNTLVYVRHKGIVINEPTIVVVDAANERRMSRQPMTRKWRRTPCGTRFITTITT